MHVYAWFIKRILALILGLSGFASGLWLILSDGDTGGGLAVIGGAGLIVSILINE